MNRCKGNTAAVYGLIVMGIATIIASKFGGGDKEINVGLITLGGSVAGALGQYITNKQQSSTSNDEDRS